MEQKTKQKMSTKKKASAAVAGVLVAALALGGAYAWTDYSQNARNTFKGTVAADVLLHDDFNGENKDVYVENTGESAVFVRVKFAEYLQVGNNSVLTAYTDSEDEAGTTPDKAQSDDVTTWPVHQFKNAVAEQPNSCGLSSHNYFEWKMTGEEKYYLAGVTESNSNGYGGLSEDAFNALTPDANVTLGDITTQKKLTSAASPVMMLSDWLALDDSAKSVNPCWLLDTDGWAYWSAALQPGTATNLLLDEVVATEKAPHDNWVYHIDVQLQAATITEMDAWYVDGVKDIADPDNSVATVTSNGLEFIKYRAGGYISSADGTVMGADNKRYMSIGNNVYAEATIPEGSTGYEPTGEYVLAGQDGIVGNDDDNLLAGRIATASTLADENGGIRVRNIDPDNMIYKLEGADDDYVVTAGIDKKLGTYDDVITSTSGALGKYNIDGEGDSDYVGWNYLGGSLDNMLVATEYVLDNVQFNGTENTEGYKYADSLLQKRIEEIGGTMNITAPVNTVILDMSDAQHEGGKYVNVCVREDCTHVGGCTLGYSDYYTVTADQADIPDTKFFALSLNEVLNAYGDGNTSNNAIRLLRIVKAAPAYARLDGNTSGNSVNSTVWKDGDGNFITTTNYWLRSPGYYGTRAAIINNYGDAYAYTPVTHTSVGARPACYLNLSTTTTAP